MHLNPTLGGQAISTERIIDFSTDTNEILVKQFNKASLSHRITVFQFPSPCSVLDMLVTFTKDIEAKDFHEKEIENMNGRIN